MGRRGPVAASATLRIVKGTEPDVANTVAESVAIKRPEKPEDLTGELSTLWDEVVAALDEAGMVSAVDGLTIALALRHFVAARTAYQQLMDADAVSVYDEKNERMAKHPADAVFRMNSELFLKYSNALGMNFVARARLALRGEDGDTENPFNPAAAKG